MKKTITSILIATIMMAGTVFPAEPKKEVSIGFNVGAGDTPKESLLLSAVGSLQANGWIISGDVASLKASVRDTLVDNKQALTIEADKYVGVGYYGFLWGHAMEMELSGLKRNVETLVGGGYEFAPRVFLEGGYGYRRRLSFGSDQIVVEEKTPVFYLGGEVDHTLPSGVILKGSADYTFGKVTSIGRSKGLVDVPVTGTPMKFRITHENVLIKPAPVGKKQNNSTTITSLVISF